MWSHVDNLKKSDGWLTMSGQELDKKISNFPVSMYRDRARR